MSAVTPLIARNEAPDVPVRTSQDDRAQRRGLWLSRLLSLAAYVLVGLAAGAYMQRTDIQMDFGNLVFLVSAALVAGWLHVLIHEAGHALAGVWVGMRIVGIGFGPWRLDRASTGWALRREATIAGISGYAVLVSTSDKFSSRRQAVHLLGGPLANLLLGGAALLALQSWPRSDGLVVLALAAFAMVGVAIGLINLLPFASGGFNSDGRQLWLLWRNRAEAWAIAHLMRYCALANLGVLPREWPEVDEAVLQDPMLPDMVADGLRMIVIARALDRRAYDDVGAQDAAARVAERFWAIANGTRQLTATMLAAWCQEAREDADRAEAWLAQSEGSLIDVTASREAVRARIALQRGDLDVASGHIEAARSAGPRLPDPASRTQLVEELAELEQRLASLRRASVGVPTCSK